MAALSEDHSWPPPSHIEATSKRQRVSVACLACRAKRMRCDGLRPVCGSCANRQVSCEYQAGESKRKPPSKRYVESLHARIKLLEDQLTCPGKSVSTVGKDNSGNSDGDIEDATEYAVSGSAESQQRDPLEEITNRVGRLHVGEDGQLRYFGSQSNFHLLHGHMGPIVSTLTTTARGRGSLDVSRLSKEMYISDELQEHLLELYWRWQNPWVYVIHKASFLDDLRNGVRDNYCTPLLLSAIFALASRYSDRREIRTDPENPNTAGDAFSEHAKVLLSYECEVATTATVQAAALMSLRAMSENKEAMGWLYSGIATRMASNLGLNLDCSKWVSAGLITERDAEVRKVAWWGCYTLDKLFAMGLGRPGTTKVCDITCPKTSLSEDAEFEPWVPLTIKDQPLLGSHTRVVSTSHYICENLLIASEALDQIYAPNNKLSEEQLEDIVTKTDVALNTFYTALPCHLRLPISSRIPTLPHIYQLHIQYHVTQILLHRPLISDRRSKSLLRSMATSDTNQHMQACRQSSFEVTRLLSAYKYHYTLRLIPIVTVHNTFTAAITHLIDATSTVPSIRRQGVRCSQVCVRALHEMSTAWTWSARSLHGLKLLAKEWTLHDELDAATPQSPKLGDPVFIQQTESLTVLSHTRPTDSSEISPRGDPNLESTGLDFDSTNNSYDVNCMFDYDPFVDLDGLAFIENQTELDMWFQNFTQDTSTSTV